MDLRLGAWEDVLADVEVDAVITDPPYSERTHSKQMHGRRGGPSFAKEGGKWLTSRGLGYEGWTPEHVHAFVESWAPRTRGWFCVFSDHALQREWESALQDSGRYVFAPLPCVMRGMNCRLAGDGPSSWTVWLTVARPRTQEAASWGTLPGAYTGTPFDAGEGGTWGALKRRSKRLGGKPAWLMRAIVRDYSRPGDLVCDPCAGYGTTLRAAIAEGRRAIGAEVDPDTHARALGLVTAETERGQLSLLEAGR